MGNKNILELSYQFENPSEGVNDNFASQFDLTKPFTTVQLIAFLKLFFYKIPFLEQSVIDKVIPYQLLFTKNGMTISNGRGNNHAQNNDNEEYDQDVVENYFNSLTEDVGNIANNEENMIHFKNQINGNPELLKEVFKIFLRDTIGLDDNEIDSE